MFDSLTYYIDKVFSSLSQAFPNYVYAPHSGDDDEEKLIDESEKQGRLFSTRFREENGEWCDQFMDSSLVDAITISTLEKKPLILYLTSSVHDNYKAYNKLLAEESVINHLKEQYICWGCDVLSNYGYSLLNEISFPIHQLPILVILFKADETSPLRLLGCIEYEKTMTADLLCTVIDQCVAHTMQEIQQAEMEQRIREENRRLAEIQQQEYEAAVAADREMMNSSNTPETPSIEEVEEEENEEEPEEEPVEEPVEEVKEMEDEKEKRMERIRANIPEEPTKGDIVRIRIIYPNGTKLQRNFLVTDAIGLLYELVELDIYDHAMNIDKFQLCSTVSKDCIESAEQQDSFQDVGIKGSCVFRVRSL